MKPDFREAAEKYADNVVDGGLSASQRSWCLQDFEKGCLHGYSLAMEQHRDFYLLVREYFKHDHFRMHEEHEALYNNIQKHLAAFTSRELESLPFKD